MKAMGYAAGTCLAVLTTAVLAAGQTTFYEANGLVVVECESVPPGTDWVLLSGNDSFSGASGTASVTGHTGPGCYRFTGNSESNGPVTGTMDYQISITNAGTYRLYMRGMEAPVESGAGDQANDCYIRMVGQDGCEGTHTKFVRLGNSYVWTFDIRLECSSHTFSDPVYDLSAGTHTFQISGRSKNFVIDRFVLKNAAISSANPENLNLPESSTSGGTQYDPTVMVSPADGATLTMGSTITLEATGENLSWSYDANSDGLGSVDIGAGVSVQFTVPTGVTGPMEITITVTGSGGTVSRTFSLTSSSTRMRPEAVRIHAGRTAGPSTLYGLDGRRLTTGSRDIKGAMAASRLVIGPDNSVLIVQQ